MPATAAGPHDDLDPLIAQNLAAALSVPWDGYGAALFTHSTGVCHGIWRWTKSERFATRQRAMFIVCIDDVEQGFYVALPAASTSTQTVPMRVDVGVSVGGPPAGIARFYSGTAPG